MNGYNKLFSTLVTSTVWCEPDTTRIVWITLLAMADKNGNIQSSIPGLAKLAGVSLEATERALQTFMEPDKYSRTPDNEGRRLEAHEGGWHMLNHGKYRAILSEESIRASKAAYMRRVRSEQGNNSTVETSGKSGQPKQKQRQSQKQEAKATVQQAAPKEVEFERFWSLYPNKQGKEPARKKWHSLKLDPLTDTIIAAVERLKTLDDKWKNGFVPMGSTFINQQRWTDEPMSAPNAARGGQPGNAPAHKTKDEAMQETETPLERELAHMAHQYRLGGYGAGMAGKAAYEEAIKATRRKFNQ